MSFVLSITNSRRPGVAYVGEGGNFVCDRRHAKKFTTGGHAVEHYYTLQWFLHIQDEALVYPA